MVDDFVKRLYAEIETRRASYLDKLIASPSTEHDRLSAHIRALDEVRKVIRHEAQRFLVAEEAA